MHACRSTLEDPTALRIAALYVLLNAGLHLSYFADFVASFLLNRSDSFPPTYAWFLYGGGLSFAIQVVLGLGLFWLAPRISHATGLEAHGAPSADSVAIGTIALRVGAVVFWDAALQRIGPLLGYFKSDAAYFAGTAGAVVALAILGTVLFLAAPGLAARLFRAEPGAAAAPLGRHVQAAAFAVVGLWILAYSGPEVVTTLGAAAARAVAEQAPSVDEFSLAPSGIAWTELVPSVLRCLLGCALFVWGAGIARYWHEMQTGARRLQTAGLAPRPPPPGR